MLQPQIWLVHGTGKCKCALWLSNLFYCFSPFLHLTPVLHLHFSSSNKLYVPPQPPSLSSPALYMRGEGPPLFFFLSISARLNLILFLSLPPPTLVSHHLFMLEHTYWVICYTPPPPNGYLCTENLWRECLFWEDKRIIRYTSGARKSLRVWVGLGVGEIFFKKRICRACCKQNETKKHVAPARFLFCIPPSWGSFSVVCGMVE